MQALFNIYNRTALGLCQMDIRTVKEWFKNVKRYFPFIRTVQELVLDYCSEIVQKVLNCSDTRRYIKEKLSLMC